MATILKNEIRNGYNSEKQYSEWFKFGRTKIPNKISLYIKNSEFFEVKELNFIPNVSLKSRQKIIKFGSNLAQVSAQDDMI